MSELTTQPLPWQLGQWQRLVDANRDSRLAHAILLAGPPGVGKRLFAEALINYLLCEARHENRACGACRSCSQLAAGSHPNRMELVPEEGKRDISVDSVREMVSRVMVSSHYGQAKVVRVDPADLLNSASTNALLKTLEEPPSATHFLLISERPRLLTPTLRSRTQLLRFPTPPRAMALGWLVQNVPGADESALTEAGGAPLRAVRWHEDGTLERRRDWAALLGKVASRRQSPLAAASAVGRSDAVAFFEWLVDWSGRGLRSAVAGDAGLPASVYEQLSTDAIEGLRALSRNANAQLSIESIMMRWLQLAARGARAMAAAR
ncbi:MAG: DNA polymerase III subunit delta' [Gammaproteobacteria bacterium]|nr:DNA polymerase III subunit delta' [Gammaproteobacteria bacterium]